MRQDEEIDPMGWQLGCSVVKGEIDARTRDRVTGRIWLLDRHFPIELTLKGNPLRDLAGCLLEFENPMPEPDDTEGICPIQMGRTGNITASLKTRVFNISPQQVLELRRRGEPVDYRIANLLSIEWYSNANGRVTLESPAFEIRISDYSWRMTPAEETEQQQLNQAAFERWSAIVAYDSDDDLDEDDDPRNWEMDEFEWERQLQESDAITKRYMALIEAFLDHPDRDRIIAHEMGWDGLDDLFDEDDDFDDITDDDEDDDVLPLEPIAHTEGRDWIRCQDGKIRHPLVERATNLTMKMWHSFKDKDRPSDNCAEAETQAMLFNMQTISAKLAGTLNALAYDDDPDGGFIVACLKRSLPLFGKVLTNLSIASQKQQLTPAMLNGFREELFSIRQDVLSLMTLYRQAQ